MEWISIKERLPEEIKTEGHGLCNLLVITTYFGHKQPRPAFFYFDKDSKPFFQLQCFPRTKNIIDTVTHWCYYPELPKEN